MKSFHPTSQRGSAFVTVTIFCAILLLLTASVLIYSGSERRLNQRAKLLQEARLGAEAVSEYGVSQVKKLMESNHTFSDTTWDTTNETLFTTGTFSSGSVAPPPDTFWTGSHIVRSGAKMPTMHIGQILEVAGLQYIDAANPNNASDPLKGKRVFIYTLDVLSSATAADPTGSAAITKYWAQKFAIRAQPLFANAVYFNMDLEVWPGPNMTITGATHTNSRLFARSANAGRLTFAGPVSAVKGIWTKYTDMPNFRHVQDDGTIEECNDTGAITEILPAGDTVPKPLKLSAPTTGFSPNLTTGTWVESTWNLTGPTWQKHMAEPGYAPITETAATKSNFSNWAQQTFKGNLLTHVNGLIPINLQGIPDYTYVYGSVYPDPKSGTSDAAYSYISGGNDLVNSAHGLVEPPRLANTVQAIEDIKYSRHSGLYIVANTTGVAANGHQPDGTVITVAPRSYRAFMNDTTNPTYVITEVILPGQNLFGPDPGTANPYTAHKNARPVVQMMNIDFATNQETANQRRMTDTRRTLGGDPANYATTTFDHAAARSATNVYVPKILNMIDIDMSELKKAVRTILITPGTSVATTDAAFYATGLPGTAFSNYIYNQSATTINVTLSDSTRIITTNTSTLTNAFTAAKWNGAIYVESIAADLFDNTGGNSAAQVKIRKAVTSDLRNSGVRLINGRGKIASIDSAQGLTVATNDALYILGHYNTDGLASTPGTVSVLTPPSPGASTGHNYEPGELPASVAADAVILLSQPTYSSATVQASGWNDAFSGHAFDNSNWNTNWATTAPSSTNRRDGVMTSVTPFEVPYDGDAANGTMGAARDTKFRPSFSEYSVAMICGLVPTGKNGVDQTSGGLHNFPRFFEDWGGIECRIRGSFVALFECRVATEPWNLRTYSAPNRIWGFNLLFGEGSMPPLTPKSIHFRRMGANDITKAAYNAKLTAWGYPTLP